VLNFDGVLGLVGVFMNISIKLLHEKCNFIIAGFVFQYTINGKKVEVAVKQIIAGKEVEQRGAFSNPETLDLYQNIPELQNF